jgi:Kdo2-lipid IVA lauroyltransferase/acyltransferase
MGALAMRLDRFNRPVAMKNLAVAFPELDRRAHLSILDGMYRNWGRMMGEWTHFGELNRGNIERFAVYDGVENLRHALELAEGRGGFVISAHFGNFELLILAHSIYGYRFTVVDRPLRNPIIDERVRSARTRFGNQTVARKKAGPTMLKLLLREHEHIGVLLDLDVRRGVFVDFFGKKASTSPGVAKLAMMTGVPVVPAFIVREGDTSRHRIVVLPPIEIVRSGDRGHSVQENTQRMTVVLESMIRRYPDHWNWIHRRWKTRPPGEAPFY